MVEGLDELAAAWWRYHGGSGRSTVDMSDEDYEFMDAIDSEVDRLSRRVVSLAALVKALINRAPAAEAIAYVGTWVLEDAETYVGAKGIREVLSSLDSASAERVASGYLPNYGLPFQDGAKSEQSE